MAHLPLSSVHSRLRVLAACVLVLAASQLQAQDGAAEIPLQAELEAYAPRMNAVAGALWNWAELGYLETRSSSLLQEELREAGFQVQGDVAGMPTAFVAHAGSGGPVIALLAGMDALPGMSQAAEPVQRSVDGQAGGHACGHNLFGAGAVAAARAIHAWLQATGTPGQVRVYGTPAEEGGSGKVYMVRDDLFDDVDAVLHWHPPIATAPPSTGRWPTSAAASASPALPRTRRSRPSAAAPRSTAWKRSTTWPT